MRAGGLPRGESEGVRESVGAGREIRRRVRDRGAGGGAGGSGEGEGQGADQLATTL